MGRDLTTRELSRLFELLALFSESSNDPRLRDQIGEVRQAVWDRLEA